MKFTAHYSLGLALLIACGTGQSAKPAVKPAPKPAAKPAPKPAHFTQGEGAIVSLPVAGSVGVALKVLFYTGSVDDPQGKEGLTKLTAKLMVEGGTQKMSYPQMLKALYPMATSVHVHVDKEQTVFSALVHPEHIKAFVPMLVDVLKAPLLGEKDFARVRQNALNDIDKRLKATDDENLGKEVLNRMLYPKGHPYHHFVGGTTNGLKAIQLDDIRAHHRAKFGKKRMLIGVGGAVTPEIQKMLSDALADLPEGDPRVEVLPAAKAPPKTKVLIVEKPSSKSIAVSMGYPHASRRGTKDFSSLALVQSYFGEHRQFHGILMAQIRGLRGINYGDYAYVENFVQEGWSRLPSTNVSRRQQHFEIWIRPVAPKHLMFSVRMALYQLEQMTSAGLTQKDVESTREFLLGYSRLWEMTPMRRLGFALDDHFYGIENYLDAYRAELQTLDEKKVNEALRRNLVKGPINIAIVAPDAKSVRDALLSGAASPIEYPVKKPEAVTKVDEIVSKYPLGLSADDVMVVPIAEMFVD